MATETTLTSVILNPWTTGTTPYTSTDQLRIPYADLGFVASAGDSYKSTAGDIFKLYVGGVRIYRTSDSLYAAGQGFLEAGDVDNTTLAGISGTWGDTTDTVWTIDTANQWVTLDTGEIKIPPPLRVWIRPNFTEFTSVVTDISHLSQTSDLSEKTQNFLKCLT